METRDRFRSISPLDHRYWAANRDLFEELAGYLGEEAGVRYGVRVELALLTELLRRLPGRDARRRPGAAYPGMPPRV